MCKKLILGSVLVLTLTLTSPMVAAEEETFTWPSIDIVEWVFGLLESFGVEAFSLEMGPAIDPIGEENPLAIEMGPGAEPNGDEEPMAPEMGPTGDPNGEPTEEIGLGFEPNGGSTEEIGPGLEPGG